MRDRSRFLVKTLNKNIMERQQLTNPYDTEHRAQYKMGSMESFLHDTLGFRTGVDQYNEQMDNAASEWAAQNQSLEYEEQYNSAAAEAARMREAGLNPDLKPDTIKPGEAGEMTEPETVPSSPGGEDMAILQAAGESAAKLGLALIDIYSGGIAAMATKQGTEIALKQYQRDTDIAEEKAIREMVNEAISIYGTRENEYYNGGYIASRKGLTGRRYEKFSRLYDDALISVPGIARKLQEKNKLNDTKRENISSERALNLEDKLWDIKDTMAKAEITIAEIKQEEARRKAEFLKNNPKFTREELEAGILKSNASEAEWNAAAAQWRKIGAEAEAKIAKANSDAIELYEKEWTTGVPELEDYLQYRRARNRMSGHHTGVNVGFGKDGAYIGIK